MYNSFMKRQPSLKGRRRLSDSADGADVYRSVSIEPSRVPRRKQIEHPDSRAADGQQNWDWDDAAGEFVGQHPRR
jgi:hypothetical protein